LDNVLFFRSRSSPPPLLLPEFNLLEFSIKEPLFFAGPFNFFPPPLCLFFFSSFSPPQNSPGESSVLPVPFFEDLHRSSDTVLVTKPCLLPFEQEISATFFLFCKSRLLASSQIHNLLTSRLRFSIDVSAPLLFSRPPLRKDRPFFRKIECRSFRASSLGVRPLDPPNTPRFF